MSEPAQPAKPPSDSAAAGVAIPAAPTAPAAVPQPSSSPVNQLTAEEQMAAFEKDLKENDWGHQPC